MPTVLRTWNLFHGNTTPPGREAFLAEMIRLGAEGADVLCLQELPVWSFRHLEEWSGMSAFPVVAQRPKLGPFPGSGRLGHAVTELNHGLFRSAFTGQGNAILLARGLRVREEHTMPLNPRGFRRAQAEWLGLGLLARLAWAKERRVVHAVRVERQSGETWLVGTLHATSFRADRRLADAELLRAAAFLDGLGRADEPLVLAGDFNVAPEESRTLRDVEEPEWGFRLATRTGIDHVLVRGLDVPPAVRWPPERRRRGELLLSDHALVEVTLP